MQSSWPSNHHAAVTTSNAATVRLFATHRLSTGLRGATVRREAIRISIRTADRSKAAAAAFRSDQIRIALIADLG
jgi:hypothetical protein